MVNCQKEPKERVYSVTADVSYNEEEGTVTFDFTSTLPDDVREAGNFFAEEGEEVELPQDLCEHLSINRLTIVPDTYRISYERNEFGRVIFRVR